MKLARRHTLKLLTLALALGGVALPALAQTIADDDDLGLRGGKVFTSSNAAVGNDLLVYERNADGSLGLAAREATGGAGSGAGLGSQGAVTLSRDGRFAFVVNAASNTVSTFAIHRKQVRLASVVDSGGVHPISVAEYDGIVYVLNDGGIGTPNANVAGFRNSGGELKPIAGSARALSAQSGTLPAQVGFSAYGDALVVTEKATSVLSSWRVGRDGTLSGATHTAASGATPFGFAFSRRNHLLVSEAGVSALSSYGFGIATPATPAVISGSVVSGQAAACWAVVTPDGAHAYTVNAGSGSLSGYNVSAGGALTLANAVAGATGGGGTDAAISPDGKHVYALATRGTRIAAFDIAADGSLTPGGIASNVPASSVGLAAN